MIESAFQVERSSYGFPYIPTKKTFMKACEKLCAQSECARRRWRWAKSRRAKNFCFESSSIVIGVATAVAKPSMYLKLPFVPFRREEGTLFLFQNFLRIGLSQFDKTLQSGRIDSSAQIL